MDSARIDVEERMFNGDDRYWVEEAKGAEVFANNTFAQVYLPKRTFPITLTRYQWNKPISRKTKFKHPGINKNKKTKRGEGFREEDYDHKPAREFRIDKTAPNDDSCTISELTQSGSLSAPDIPIVPFKRSHEEALGHVVVVEEAAAPKRVRLPEGWSVRVGRMGGKNRYGDRASIKVDSFLGPGRDDLKHYSLIIPAFTQCSGIIPSGKDKQRALPWLWNTCEHPRFFGVLDMDMETQAVFEGQEPLFRGMPAVPYEKLSHVKKAFTQRLVSGSTFGQLLAQCPSFALLYRTVRALDLALQVPHVTYFSGGGGFRVLFYSPLAWRLVTWGQTYALTFHDEQLEGLLHQVAPTLEQPPLDYLLYRTDKNIYDSDKGTKPDLLAHFSTHVYPRQLDESFERSRPSCDQADEPLFKAIRAFWQRVFESIPLEAPRIVAPLSKPASIYYANVLYDFPKAPSYEKATHFALQNNKTSYRCVPNVETLYQRLLNQRASGLPLNFHEMRTPVTRHALDYDGGPPLLQPLRRRDGLMETPLHAIQEIHRTLVLVDQAAFPGVLLSCLPRLGKVGTRAHLIWPDWHVNLVDEGRILYAVETAMKRRWPDHLWSTFLESPIKMRCLFSDTINKETGFMSNRPLRFETAFDVQGRTQSATMYWPDQSDVGLLRLCSLRLNPGGPCAPLLPLVAYPGGSGNKEDTSVNATLAKLPEAQQVAVLATLNQVLEELRVKHNKPDLRFYSRNTIKVSRQYRNIMWELKDHRQCVREHTHSGNNVSLKVHMDRNAWELHCWKKECPYRHVVDPTWNRGVVDTSALRAAWPRSPAGGHTGKV